MKVKKQQKATVFSICHFLNRIIRQDFKILPEKVVKKDERRPWCSKEYLSSCIDPHRDTWLRISSCGEKQTKLKSRVRQEKQSVVFSISYFQSVMIFNATSTTGFSNCQLNKNVYISKSMLFSSRDSVHMLRYLLSFLSTLVIIKYFISK